MGTHILRSEIRIRPYMQQQQSSTTAAYVTQRQELILYTEKAMNTNLISPTFVLESNGRAQCNA